MESCHKLVSFSSSWWALWQWFSSSPNDLLCTIWHIKWSGSWMVMVNDKQTLHISFMNASASFPLNSRTLFSRESEHITLDSKWDRFFLSFSRAWWTCGWSEISILFESFNEDNGYKIISKWSEIWSCTSISWSWYLSLSMRLETSPISLMRLI